MVSELPEDALGEVCRLLASGSTYDAQHALGRLLGRSWWEVQPEMQELARLMLDGVLPPQPLLDLTAAVQLRNSPYGPTPAEMLEIAEHYSVEQRVAAFALASALRTIADRYCDTIHDGLRTCDQVKSILHKECPGYSDRTYDEACNRGLFNTM